MTLPSPWRAAAGMLTLAMPVDLRPGPVVLEPPAGRGSVVDHVENGVLGPVRGVDGLAHVSTAEGVGSDGRERTECHRRPFAAPG